MRHSVTFETAFRYLRDGAPFQRIPTLPPHDLRDSPVGVPDLGQTR